MTIHSSCVDFAVFPFLVIIAGAGSSNRNCYDQNLSLRRSLLLPFGAVPCVFTSLVQKLFGTLVAIAYWLRTHVLGGGQLSRKSVDDSISPKLVWFRWARLYSLPGDVTGVICG